MQRSDHNRALIDNLLRIIYKALKYQLFFTSLHTRQQNHLVFKQELQSLS